MRTRPSNATQQEEGGYAKDGEQAFHHGHQLSAISPALAHQKTLREAANRTGNMGSIDYEHAQWRVSHEDKTPYSLSSIRLLP